jgi:predicted secreted protein
MSQPDDTLTLRPGERRELRLPALGAAGYTWTSRLEGDAEAVDVAHGRPPAEELEGRPIGASADVLVTVTARRPGHVTLHLEHRRVWEADRPPLEHRHYDIEITPPA